MSDVSTPRPPVPQPGLSGPVLGLLFAVIAMAPLAAAALSGIEPADAATEFATGLGLVAASLMFLQFWSSGRYEFLSGRIGIDQTMGFHRISAIGLVLLALAHPLAYVLQTAVSDPAAAWSRLIGMLSSPRLSTGFLALAGLVVLTLISVFRLALFRRYETWRALHGLLAIAVAGLVLHHALVAGAYATSPVPLTVWLVFALAAGAALVIVYVLRPLRMVREGWRLVSVTPAGEKTWHLTLLGPANTAMRFRGGQFVWLTFAPHRPPLHDHPFSITSSPSELPRLRFVVREAGDCTDGFGELAPGTAAALDGPHGSFILPDGAGPVLLVAGGVGIAPMLGILEEAASRNDPRRFVLLYGERHDGALACRDRLDALGQHLDLHVVYVLDERESTSAALQGPITAAIIGGQITGAPAAAWTAFVCGPLRMTEHVTDALLDLGVAPDAIHYERFDYGTGGGRLDRRRSLLASGVLAVVIAGIAAFGLRAL